MKRGKEAEYSKKNNKKIFWIILFAFVAFAFLLSGISIYEKNRINFRECEKDSDCVKNQITCCSCEAGGQEACISKDKVVAIKKQIQNCPEDSFCSQVYNCKIKSCKCTEGSCES